MTWARLDDGFHTNPKILGLTDKQFRLYVTSITYAAYYLTDGFLTDDAVRVLGAQMGLERPKSVAKALANSTLFHREEGGYRIHDYLAYNPSKAHVETERARNAERKRRQRHGGTDTVSHTVSPNAPTRSTPHSQVSERGTTYDQPPSTNNTNPAPDTKVVRAIRAIIRGQGWDEVTHTDSMREEFTRTSRRIQHTDLNPHLADTLIAEWKTEREDRYPPA